MQSALILAQDRLPNPLQQVLEGRTAYDGRLTAAQILRTWKLDAELVTLSACRTGLGPYHGGEGYLGFSQAFFLAGARSLVLSLWKVDDTATALLMIRFYQNLLGQRAGLRQPMPKAQALDEAKRWLRSLPADQVRQLAASLQAGDRGVEVSRRPAPVDQPDHPYQHPYYWAGFILVGDPGGLAQRVPAAPASVTPSAGLPGDMAASPLVVLVSGTLVVLVFLARLSAARFRSREPHSKGK